MMHRTRHNQNSQLISGSIMASDALQNFAKHMVEIRKQHGWSQPILAEKVGTASTAIGRYERGEVTPSIEIAKRIADVLGTSLDYMLGSATAADPAQEKAFADRIRVASALPSEDQQHILYLLDAVIRDARARTAYG
jgi:transcriptional regulator with XRE-family HTH domain